MFHERLDALCKSKGISRTDFSVNKLGVSNSAATSWKKGAIPRSDIVIKAAKYFGVSTDYLLGLDDVPSRRQQEAPTPAEAEMLSEFRSASPFARAIAWASARAALSAAATQQEQFNSALANTEPLGYAMTIPAGGNLPIEGFAAAGSPLFSPETEEKSVPVQEKYTEKDMNGRRYFVVVARGDSMEPEIPDGTPVVVQRDLHPLSGEVALVTLESPTDEPEYVIKKVRYLPNEVELSSFNEAYKPFQVPLSEVVKIEKVVHVLTDM